MASLQSDSARSKSCLAHHHPHRLLNAAERSCAAVLGSSITRSHAAMLSLALANCPANLHRSRSASLSASARADKDIDAANAASSTKERIFPPAAAANAFSQIALTTLTSGDCAT